MAFGPQIHRVPRQIKEMGISEYSHFDEAAKKLLYR